MKKYIFVLFRDDCSSLKLGLSVVLGSSSLVTISEFYLVSEMLTL